MKLTYYGHSCFLVETDNSSLLFDPFITPNPLAKEIDITTIMPEYICLSHGHADHIADCETIAKQSGATIIASWEVCEWFTKKGVTKVHPMNTGGTRTFNFGRLKCVEAVHSSSMPDGANGGSAMGFLIQSENKSLYFAGDTALTYNMKLIGEYNKPDIALLPIGSNFTMNVSDAVIAASFIQCKQIIGMHYDTFGYIIVDHEAAVKEFEAAGCLLQLMEIGTSISI